MKNRKWMVSIAVLALIALNVWRWWPAGSTAPKAKSVGVTSSVVFRPEDFEIRAVPTEPPGPMLRDLFRSRPTVKSVAKTVPVKTAEPPPKSPEELEVEAAKTELAQIRCVGVALRNGRAQAFLVRGGETFLVSPGDRVGNRFIVDKIGTETVSLQDPNSGVTGEIAVSGK